MDTAVSNPTAAKLDPRLARAWSNRGAAYRGKGDDTRAIANYEQALRLDPKLDTAAENLAVVRKERDNRAGLPESSNASFDCHEAMRAVEKAICADHDLSRLDRDIDEAYKAAQSRLDGKALGKLRAAQREFINTRNKSFGHAGYDLRREMEKRFYALRSMTASN